jgi:hypothetical protein
LSTLESKTSKLFDEKLNMAKRQVSLLSYFGNANGPTQQQIKSYDRDDNRKFKSKWFMATATQIILATPPLYSQNATW